MTTASVEAVFIATEDTRALAHFYAEGLALPPPREAEAGQWGVSLPNLYLGFEPVPTSSQRAGPVTLWFRVDDMAKAVERLTNLGARLKAAPQGKGEQTAELFDPDGHGIGLISG